jgi:hypothetical protein
MALQHFSQPLRSTSAIQRCVTLLLLLLLLPCRPVLFLLNGANVESKHYSTLASHSAARGSFNLTLLPQLFCRPCGDSAQRQK